MFQNMIELAVPTSDVKSNSDLPPCLSVVMPVYNEAATVEQIIRVVLEQKPVEELIAVDDGSTDGCWDILRKLAKNEPRLRIYTHVRNQGKGSALATGFSVAKAPIVTIQDADLEYDPTEYYLLLKPILADKADVVYGSRF